MEHDRAYDEPSEVSAEEGEVLVDGPDGVAVTFTPDAPTETSQRPLNGAAKAHGQKLDEEQRRKK